MATTEITVAYGSEKAGLSVRLYASDTIGVISSVPVSPVVNSEKWGLHTEGQVLVGQGNLDEKGKLTFKWEEPVETDRLYQAAILTQAGWHLTNPLGEVTVPKAWYDQIVDDYGPSAAIGPEFSDMTNQSDLPAAYGDTIRTISDYTGNGYDFTERAVGAGPEYVENGIDGFDALDFDFSDSEYMICDINMNAGLVNMVETDKGTVLAVMQYEHDEGYTTRGTLVGTSNSNSSSWIGLGQEANSETIWGDIGFAFNNNLNNVMIDQVPSVVAVAGIDDGVDDEATTYVGGHTRIPDVTMNTTLSLTQKAWLGNNQRGGYGNWNGKCAGVFWFNRRLSTTEVEEITAIVQAACPWYTIAESFTRPDTVYGAGDLGSALWEPMSDLTPDNARLFSQTIYFDGPTSNVGGEGFVRTEKLVSAKTIIVQANLKTETSSGEDDSVSYWFSADDSDSYDNGYRLVCYNAVAALYRVVAGSESLVSTETLSQSISGINRTIKVKIDLNGSDPSFEIYTNGTLDATVADSNVAKFTTIRRMGFIGRSENSTIREHTVSNMLLHYSTN